MTKIFVSGMIMLSFSIGCQGCTCQAWYDALKDKQRLDCQGLPGVRERQDCLDRINSQTYDQYKEELERSKKANP
jgi:hypothetical protein